MWSYHKNEFRTDGCRHADVLNIRQTDVQQDTQKQFEIINPTAIREDELQVNNIYYSITFTQQPIMSICNIDNF